jgi:hypothetical protein
LKDLASSRAWTLKLTILSTSDEVLSLVKFAGIKLSRLRAFPDELSVEDLILNLGTSTLNEALVAYRDLARALIDQQLIFLDALIAHAALCTRLNQPLGKDRISHFKN